MKLIYSTILLIGNFLGIGASQVTGDFSPIQVGNQWKYYRTYSIAGPAEIYKDSGLRIVEINSKINLTDTVIYLSTATDYISRTRSGIKTDTIIQWKFKIYEFYDKSLLVEDSTKDEMIAALFNQHYFSDTLVYDSTLLDSAIHKVVSYDRFWTSYVLIKDVGLGKYHLYLSSHPYLILDYKLLEFNGSVFGLSSVKGVENKGIIGKPYLSIRQIIFNNNRNLLGRIINLRNSDLTTRSNR